MDVHKYISQEKKIYDDFLFFIENNEWEDNSFNQFITIIKNSEILNKREELESFLQLIINISNNHHRNAGFFGKIKQILHFLEKEIKIFFSNQEIFQLFESNKLLLLYFIEKKIITYDGYVNKFIENKIESNCMRYFHFFLPEIISFKNSDQRKEKFENELKSIDNYEEKRQLGENDSYICSLIRLDSAEEFIQHVSKTNLLLSSHVEPSIFETNSFLIDNEPTLIEYAAFYGSIQIFQYLKMNGVELKPSLWLYSIHSQNASLIHLLEENKVGIPDGSYEECLIEAIKCHHNDFAVYIKDNFLYDKTINNKLVIKNALRFSNYEFIPESFNEKEFFNLCEYNYTNIVNCILEKSKTDIETKAVEANEIEVVYYILLHRNRINTDYFRGCGHLRKLAIPSSVTSIEKFSFDECYCLKEISLPSSVTRIGNCAFRGCSNLKRISIPPSVTSIEEFTFDGCSSLREVLIPCSVVVIGEYAFNRCYSLKEITIPFSVESIGSFAFAECRLDLIRIPAMLVSKIRSVSCQNIIRL